MIPRFGRVLPFITAVLGIIDARLLWPSHIYGALVLLVATAYLIYIMFRRHHAMSPKKTAYYLVTTFLLIALVLVSTYFVFF
jgi:hypothetical protein